ncbi:MAG: helicase-related protein, partial [Opitutales bacterium]
MQSHNRFVLTAPTGAGKSTQVPQMLLDGLSNLKGCILVLQPRRLAARTLAKRVAAERRKSLGGEVGFQVRFQAMASPDTRILYITLGLFWRRLISDPELSGISAVLFDEFHERHIAGDLALSRIIDIQKTRQDLLIGVMSATLETTLVEDFLQPCKSLCCEGRSFPVTTEYSEDGLSSNSRPVWVKVSKSLPKVLRKNPEGDVLVFMPGAYEIRRTVEALSTLIETRGMDVFALHGEMPPEQQDRVPESISRRKIIVATNVAETSLTIEGVRIVIDSGLARIFRFDSRRCVDTLLTERISQASAEQRTGRAGRVAPGYCLRLWKKQEQAQMQPYSEPEIHRIDLASSILEMRASGVDNPAGFAWLEAPDPAAIAKADQLLSDLGAIDPLNRILTKDGVRMAAFPLHPRYARLLLEGEKRGCLGLVCQMAAFVQGRNFLLPLKESRKEKERQELLRLHEMPGSDFFYLFKAFNLAAENRFSADFCRQWGIHGVAAREAWQTARQFLDLAKEQNMNFSEEDVDLVEVRKCLLAAFPEQVARRLDRGTLR